MTRPVYIAGRGAVSAFGSGVDALVDGALGGICCLRARRRTADFEAPTAVAGEFPEDGLGEDLLSGAAGEGVVDGHITGELSMRATLLAAREALTEAGVDLGDRGGPASPLASMGLVLATTKADLAGLVGQGAGYGIPARLTERVGTALHVGGGASSVSTACASGVTAIAMAERRIALGEVDRALVLGVDTINHFIMAGFGAMGLLDPGPCRPFDLSRRGISLGDGAGAIVLTSRPEESIGARISGHGGANDACSVTSCHRDGLGVTLATRRALERAGCAPDSVDVLHVHGTGTKANDFSEAKGLGVTFGGATAPAFGTKGQIGHTLGAAGVLESLVALGALERARVPANVGLEESNVDPRLSLTREAESLQRARCALKVCGGFGGIQQAVVIEV